MARKGSCNDAASCRAHGPAETDRKPGANDFNAVAYWEQRLGGQYDLTGVGRRNFGIHFNRWAYRARRRAFSRAIRSLEVDPASCDVLDIGAGTGFYIDAWQALGAVSPTGIDVTDVAVAGLRDRYPESRFHRIDVTGDLGELAGRRFDLISCMDVLFHIVDDVLYRHALHNVFSLLKPGGAFVFSEGFVHGETRRAEHVVHRSSSDIEDHLSHAGFELVRRRPFLVMMNDPIEPDRRFLRWFWRRLERIVRRHPIAGSLAGCGLYPLEVVLARLLTTSPSTEIMVCRRAGQADR